MNIIPFPSIYKQSLLKGKKNYTIRIFDEVSKYKVNCYYQVQSYAGKNWGVKVQITQVIPTTIVQLTKFGIPKRSVEAILNNNKISLNDRADLVKFKLIK